MAKVRGVVFRAGKSKFGYYVKLDGNETFFNTKYEPKCEQGDEVGIEYVQKGRSCNISKLVVLSKAGRREQGGNGNPAPADRNDSIVWQSSRKDAIAAADLLLRNGAVKLPKTEDGRAAIIAGLVDKLTYVYFNDAVDPRNSSTFKNEAGVQEDAEEPKEEWGGEGEAEESPWGDEDAGGGDDVQWD